MTKENFRVTEEDLEYLANEFEDWLDVDLAQNYDRARFKNTLERDFRFYHLPEGHGKSEYRSQLDELTNLTNVRREVFTELINLYPDWKIRNEDTVAKNAQ